ncbi:uncharacterized protein C7orf26-like [Actinia tenebrosa]|uniref:Uncharacterized protein C7orf26-like n=1 Tax=Actinia tenebrosa TaxID=6105 RepID=A0A6P8IDB2_ACTTE|nr:uncharacterized protein C7orf26-like [Actinia tenebrosa]
MISESSEEDIWVISSWRTDIPNKVKFINQSISRMPFPDCCYQVVHALDRYFESSDPESIKTPALFISAFLVELIDQYLFHITDQNKSSLTALQELRLLELLNKHFKEQKSDFVRWLVFDTLFSFSNQEQKEKKFNRRLDLLTKLVSMAIALRNGNIMDCMALWMQKHRHFSSIVVQVSTCVIEDYSCLVPVSLPFLQSVSLSSPHLACQLIVALTSIHTMITTEHSSDSLNLHPALSTLKVIVKWISQDPSICLIKPNRTLITLPSLHSPTAASPDSPPLPLCPVRGLVQWTVLEPLTRLKLNESSDMKQSLKDMYSELHLGLLQALVMSGKSKFNPKDDMELEPGEVMDESDTLRHLLDSKDLKRLTESMVKFIDSLNEAVDILPDARNDAVNISIDRIAQIIQVSIATGCLSSSKGDLLEICKSVPNNCLETVVANLDSL